MTIDTTLPTANLVISDTSITTGETATVTITFSEMINAASFTLADLTSDNGTLSALTNTDGEGVTWTATFTPNNDVNDGENYITLNTANITDLAGNAGTQIAMTQYYGVSTPNAAPTATVTVVDNFLDMNQTSAVNIAFSEAVTGLTVADLTVANGVVSGLSSADGGVNWTGTLTPNTGVQDTSNVVTLDMTGVVDLGSKAGVGSVNSGNYAVDTRTPTATITMSDTALTGNDTSLVTFAFDEWVTGFDATDLTISNGTLSALTPVDEGSTWTATFTPTANFTDATNTIVLDNSGVDDLRGNAGTGNSESANFTINTGNGAPTATITVDNTFLTTGGTSTVTITFSEYVPNLTLADLTAANGTLSNLWNDEGVNWTATLTPNAGIEDHLNVVTLDNTGITDISGNAGVGTTTSNNYGIDNKGPTATITMADNALTLGETSLVTITFSEGVTSFDASDLTVQNGTIGTIATVDEGMTYTATFTPATNVFDGTNVITLNNAGVYDYYNNVGTGSTDSANYSVTTGIPIIIVPTPTPTPTPVPSVVVDGVKVSTKTTTAADGSKNETITIPTVVSTRANTEGGASVADIPLVTTSAGVKVLDAAVPTGFGLQVSGSATAKAATDSLAGLIAAIEARTEAGSQGQASLVSGGSSFLGTLDAATPMYVRTIVATAASGASTTDALVISGLAHTEGSPQTALVIDTSGLPSGSTIELQNVEFAAVIGAANVTGGAGSQHVWGDGASQNIFLGEDDDILHGGAGDDIVGSAGGNDQIFGDEGNDIVFGGLGNDTIDGGTGRDIVTLAGAGRGDYSLRVTDGKLVMTQLDGGADGIDTVSNVEVLRFAGAADVAFNDIDVASLVRLYDTAFGRAADEAGINFWIEQAESGVTLGQIATGFVASAEAQPQYASLSNEAYVAALYVDGLGRTGGAAEARFWIDHLNQGHLTRGETLLAFADSAEKIALVGVIDTSIETI